MISIPFKNYFSNFALYRTEKHSRRERFLKISEISLYNFHKQKTDFQIIEAKNDRIVLKEYLTEQRYLFLISHSIPEDPNYPHLSTPTGAVFKLSRFISRGELVLNVYKEDGLFVGNISHPLLSEPVYTVSKGFKHFEDCLNKLKKHQSTLPAEVEIDRLIKNTVVKQKRSSSSKSKKNQEQIKKNRENKINENAK